MKLRMFVIVMTAIFFAGCSSPPSNVADEVIDDLVAGNISPQVVSATGPVSGPSASTFLGQLFDGAGDGRLNMELPNYAYFQGILHSNRHIITVGQVRVVGGMVVSYNGGTVDLYRGAMVTSLPDYYMSRFGELQGGGNQGKFVVADWKEVPAN